MNGPTQTDPPLAALLVLLFVALVLAVVALVRSSNASPIDSFLEATTRDDYEEAALFLTDERGVQQWLTRTESLALRHGEVEGYQRSDRVLPVSGGSVISVVTLQWSDGYSRCLLLQEGEDYSLRLVRNYFDCDTLSERVPEGGRLLPENRPPDGPGGPDGPGVPDGPDPSGPPAAGQGLPPVPDAPLLRLTASAARRSGVCGCSRGAARAPGSALRWRRLRRALWRRR